MTEIVVAGRTVQAWREGGHWAASVDGRRHPEWFMSEAQAAGAALLRAYALARRSAVRRTRPRRAGRRRARGASVTLRSS